MTTNLHLIINWFTLAAVTSAAAWIGEKLRKRRAVCAQRVQNQRK